MDKIQAETVSILLSIIGVLGLIIFHQISGQLRELTKNIFDLNEKLAVVITKIESHDKRITILEK